MKFSPDINVLIKPLFTILALCLLLIPNSNGQSRKQLEKQRKQLLKDIQLTTSLFKETKRDREATYDRYVALQKQVQKRTELINTLEKELQLIDESTNRTTGVIIALQEDIARLKTEYGNMLRKAYRHKQNNNSLFFLFSSENFNQAFQRWRYLKQYEKYRKKQAHLIVETEQTLASKIASLEKKKADKHLLLASQNEQGGILQSELVQKGKMLKDLRKDEKKLQRDLKKYRLAHSHLNDAIEKIIKSEMAARRRKTRVSPGDIARVPKDLVAERKLTKSFSGNKGKLPWPVKQGVITKWFGKQAHPTLKKIEITNNGIDIRTDKRAEVRAVFDGEVVGVQFVPGYSNMLLIKHGNYYTVYSNIDEVFVKRGARVRTKQVIGRVTIDKKSNKSEVHFEVWRDKIRLNPTDWIAKK